MAITLQQFVDALGQSGLMSAADASSFQQSLPPEKQPRDAQTLAQSLVQAGKLTKYQAQMVYQGKPKGLVFGEYTVLDKLGQGGMGVVLKARHRRMDRLVAVKMLLSAAMKSPEAVQRFYREVKAAAKLNHPNIVQAHDASEHEGIHYLVMEYVEGSDLGAAVKERGPLEVKQALDCILQAAKGLAYAHGQGVVHRDIKPSNLLLDKSGTVKILDMGLARIDLGTQDPAELEQLTRSGEVMGTCHYMAPEQAEDTHKADQRSDVYSLGCTLYRLFTGKPPYEGDTFVKVIFAHRDAPIPSLRNARPDIPEEVEAIYRKMMAKRPEDRYQSMTEVVGDLEACLAARKPAAVVDGNEPADDSSVNGWLEQISSPGPPPLPLALPRGEATMVRRVEEETRKTIHTKPVIAANKRLWLAVSTAGGLALLLIVALVLGRGGKTPDAAQLSSGEATAKTQAASPPVEKASPPPEEGSPADFPGLAPPSADANASPPAALPQTPSENKPMETGEQKTGTLAKPPVQIDTAERQQETKAEKPAVSMPEAKQQPQAGPSPEEQKQRERDARFAEAMASVEKLAAAWDFSGAAVELGTSRFEEPELTARSVQRRNELKRMNDLKQKIIAAIHAASPPMKKSALGIKGLGGDVLQADEQGITCKLINGKTELLAWGNLGPKATPKLAHLAVARTSADDWIAAGLLGLLCSDPMFAEGSFEQARGLGANIESYLTPLATAALARATDLLKKKRFAEAAVALEDLERKYVAISWFRDKQKAITALRARAKGEAQEAEAEELYAKAAGLFADKELYDLKPLVEKLKADYSNTRPVLDRDRTPLFSEMEKGVAKIGRRLTVRLDGKGHFRTIQAAVNAANIGDLVEIEDNGPYSESVTVSAEKSGLILRGAKGTWPLLISAEPNSVLGPLILVKGPNTTVQRMVLVNLAAVGRTPHCLCCEAAGMKVEALMTHQPGAAIGLGAGGSQFNNCIIVGTVGHAFSRFQNCFITTFNIQGPPSEVRTCTIQSVDLVHAPIVFGDCIIGDLKNPTRAVGHRIDHCVTFGDVSSDIERGQGCLSANPMFRDPANLDYGLKPGSPCIGKASDGGDIGCRYTPEMIELCEVALELRRKGILKF